MRAARFLLLIAFLPALAGCQPELRIERVDFQDLPAPAMFRELAVQLRRPFLMELPARELPGRHDLQLDDVTLRRALEAIVELNPEFQQAQSGEVLAYWPSGAADLEASPYSKIVTDFRGSGGAGEVLRQILVQAGIADTTDLSMHVSGVRRPVSLDLRRSSVRDALIQVASQAHVAFIIEPGLMNVVAIPE